MLEILGVIVLLIFLEGILSIDNAAVLGAMVAHLPRDRAIPWPKSLKWMSGAMDRWLGHQQSAALKVGLLGAYVGRGLMLGLAFVIVKNQWILVLGSGYLLWLGVNHFAKLYHKENAEQNEAAILPPKGFWYTVLIIELVDLAFSLDNVVVAVQMTDRFWVIALGVAIGILAMRFAAQIFTYLIEWEPNLEHAAFALLLVISTETFIKIFAHLETPHWLKFLISMLVLALTVGMSKLAFMRPLKRVLRLGLPLAMLLDRIIGLVLWPVRWLLGLLMAPFRSRVAERLSGDNRPESEL
ncbi:MAG TPA: tellurium resistance protein TerC [Herpetosiphonaceae bacterium]|nr:tellurium resistance protein TerC [Herpetosiphonaceae bacterium]